MLSKINIDNLHAQARQIIEKGKNATYRAINSQMIQTYWEIGQLIVEDEQQGNGKRAEYGKYVISALAKRLQMEYGSGYNQTNLRNCRHFYLTYPIRHALRDELTWTHYRIIMRVEDPKARTFYETETIQSGWNTRVLERQINVFYYERLLSSRQPEAVKAEALEKMKRLLNILF